MNNDKVFSYRNLHRKGVVWSIKSCKTGLVVAREKYVIFRDVELKVSKAGHLRVIDQKRKNVHAGVKGVRIKYHPKNRTWIRARYNPYDFTKKQTPVFKDMDGNPILTCKYAKLCKTGLYVSL